MTNDQAKSLTGAIHDLGSKVITSLPPTFVALLAINVLFIAIVLLFEHWQAGARAELIGKLLDSCVRVMEAK